MKVIALLLMVLVLFMSETMADLKQELALLDDYTLNNNKQYQVNDFVITVESGEIILENGVLFLLGELADEPIAAFFIGQGSFSYNPNNAIERQQVNRFYKTDSIDIPLDYAYFAFPSNSSIFKNLTHDASAYKPDNREKTIFKHCRELPHREFYYNLPFQILKATREGRDDYMYVDMLTGEYDHTIYASIPERFEPVAVYRFAPGYKDPQMVSSIKSDRARDEEEISLLKYDITANICTYCKSEIAVELKFRVNVDSLKYLSFTIPDEYKIDSVGKAAADFLKKKDRSEIHLALDNYYQDDDTVTVTMYYRTNMFYHIMNYGVIQMNLTQWLPYYGYRQLADYEVRYKIDEGYSFLSVGRMIDNYYENGYQYLHYKTDHPVAYISFNYGLFDTVTVDNSFVPVNLYYLSKQHGSSIFGMKDVENVADDVGRAFLYYHNNIAPYQFDRLDVDAMAVGFGQGSPGIVHLAEITFDRSYEGIDDKFRAHEVAHQWWGHMISPFSYHDVWLSEGFSEFSAAMYILEAVKDVGTFGNVVANWRNNIIQGGRLNGELSHGFKAGAVSLGHRLNSELSPGDYSAIVYYKGAYILNMLRYELRVLYGEEKIMELLSAFVRKHYIQTVTTEDFKRVVGDYLGERTDQFFDQWVYDWRVPEIKSGYKKKSDDTIELLISVDKIDDNFTTFYPVRVNFKDDSYQIKHFEIKKGENKIQFIKPGKKINSVDFNPYKDILEL